MCKRIRARGGAVEGYPRLAVRLDQGESASPRPAVHERGHLEAHSILAIVLPAMLIGWPSLIKATPGQASASAQAHVERGLELARAGELASAEAELRQAVEIVPNNPNNLAELGTVLAMEGKLEKASFYFTRALKLDPTYLVARQNLAAIQWQRGLDAEAKVNLEIILKAQPGNPPSVMLLGMVEDSLKDYRRAAELLSSVPALVKDRPESIVALARAFYHTGRKDQARATLDELGSHPAAARGIFLGGRVAAEAGDYTFAEKMFASIKAIYPEPLAVGYNLALSQYQQQQYEESRKTLLELLGARLETAEVYNLLGWSYYKQDRIEEALEALMRGIDNYPASDSNYLDMARMLTGAKRYGEAMEVLKKAADTVPHFAQAYQMMGLVQTKQADYNGAVQSYSRALELDPSLGVADAGLGAAQFYSGMTREAKTTFEHGLKRFPRDTSHYEEYARLCLKLSDTGDKTAAARAASLLKTAIALDASRAEPFYLLGNLRLAQGRAEEAVPLLKKAAKLDSTDSKIHYALWRVYRRLGQDEEASAEKDSYLKLKAQEEKSTPGPPRPGGLN